MVEDRADIVFEVRDATDLKPSGKTDWWLELPAAGASEWAERASARKRRSRYRLAFVPTKFRVGEEPDPFIWEIDLSGEPWVLRDVTESVLNEGQMVAEQERAEKENRTEVIVQELVAMVRTRAKTENPMRSQKEAVPFLTNRGYTRDSARDLIEARDGQNWKIWTLKDQRGSPKVLMPLSPDRPISNDSAEIIPDGKNLVPIGVSETRISATPMDTRPQKSEVTEPLSDKGFRDERLFPPRYSDKDPKQQEDDPDNSWEGF